jgi:hypothetical protein
MLRGSKNAILEKLQIIRALVIPTETWYWPLSLIGRRRRLIVRKKGASWPRPGFLCKAMGLFPSFFSGAGPLSPFGQSSRFATA